MKQLFASLFAGALATAVTLTGVVVEGHAAPVYGAAKGIAANVNVGTGAPLVEEVQYRRGHRQARRSVGRGHHRGHAGRGYYRGHRGYRHQRPGYRYHDGFWFPPAAFALGAIVGGAIASQPSVRYVPVDAHVDWCRSRYRSYRASDNTFQPYNAPRRQCRSPYR